MSKPLNDCLKEASLLNVEILTGELVARGIIPARGPLINKRRQLASAWLKEKDGQIFVPYFEHDPLVDLRKCAALVTSFEVEINRNDSSQEEKLKAIANLKVLDARIGRILCTNNEEEALARNLSHNVKRLILADIVDLNSSNGSANEHDQDGVPNTNHAGCSAHHGTTNDHESTLRREKEPIFQDNFPPSSGSKNINVDPYELENAMANIKLTSPDPFNQSFVSRKLPIHKWNIRFSGSDDKKDAFEFLRIVNSKARSYQTSQDELFASASEFFIGEASKWYFSQDFVDWSDLTEKLLADFMQVNYFDDLIDIVRQRKQTSNETIVQFFTIFEDNCSRLRVPLSNSEKISILKRNVLQKYQSYIALMSFQSLNAMKHALKVLEATMSQNNHSGNRFVRFDSRERRSFSRERYSHSPNRYENSAQSNHVSRYDKLDTRNNDFRSPRDRTRSPYPNQNNQRVNDVNKQRDRSNSNSGYNNARTNSRERGFFRSTSQEKVKTN